VHRRSVLWLLATVPLAGCGGESQPAPPAPSIPSSPPGPSTRPAAAGDYRWLTTGDEFAKGFSFLWVQGLTSKQVLDRLGGKELERVFWHQLVGPGDGQRGSTGQRFFGVARVGDWVLVVEEAGTLGISDVLLDRLSAQTTVISHYRGAEGEEQMLVLTDGAVDLRFDPQSDAARTGRRAAELSTEITSAGFGAATDPQTRTAAAFALTERLTGIAMTREMLEEKTYLLSTAPQQPRN
jgi:hypothetical protein